MQSTYIAMIQRQLHIFRALGCLPLVWIMTASQLSAEEIRVDSLSDLRSAIANASPGDKIIVTDGKYINEGPIDIASAGTKTAQIEISAETVSGVEISGSVGFSFKSPAAYVILQGFRLTHKAGTLVLPAGTHHCRIARNIFELNVARRSAYMTVSGDDHEIDHNTFQNKNTEGQMLEVQGPRGRAMAQRTWIHHNYFHNFENSRRNNSSALHVGHSSRSLSPANCVVEYNLFSMTRGENEGAICNKSCDNTYRFNTIGEGCTELSCATAIVAWSTAISLSARAADCGSSGTITGFSATTLSAMIRRFKSATAVQMFPPRSSRRTIVQIECNSCSTR